MSQSHKCWRSSSENKNQLLCKNWSPGMPLCYFKVIAACSLTAVRLHVTVLLVVKSLEKSIETHSCVLSYHFPADLGSYVDHDAVCTWCVILSVSLGAICRSFLPVITCEAVRSMVKHTKAQIEKRGAVLLLACFCCLLVARSLSQYVG